MPLLSLTDVQGLPDPATAWSWTASILLPDNISDNLDNNGLALGGFLDKRYVLDVTLPMPQISQNPRYRGGSIINFPGQNSYSPCSITFYESSSFYVVQTLLNWQSRIFNPNGAYAGKAGNYGLPKSYFSQITIEHFDNKGNKQLEADLIGVWPINLQDVALSYSANHNIPITCVFSVNDVNYRFGADGTQSDIFGPGSAFAYIPHTNVADINSNS